MVDAKLNEKLVFGRDYARLGRSFGKHMYFQWLRKNSFGIQSLMLLMLLSTVLLHCSGKESSSDDPDTLFREAEEALKDEHYVTALEKFRDIKNRFPYSSRAVDAELRIADAYFEQESYLEAESAYEIFKELHPTHPKIDYVQFRIGLSYYKQIPDNSARDLTAAYHAIESFETLNDKFPSSEYNAKGKEFIVEARKRLAEHEAYVADFYFRRKHYLSASYRYSALLKDFSQLGYDEESLYRLGQSYANVLMWGNAKDAYQRLLAEFPNSDLKSDVQAALQDLNKHSP